MCMGNLILMLLKLEGIVDIVDLDDVGVCKNVFGKGFMIFYILMVFFFDCFLFVLMMFKCYRRLLILLCVF